MLLFAAALGLAIASGRANQNPAKPRTPSKALGAANPPLYAPPYTSVEVAKGQALFAQRCEICHFGASSAQKIGPGLKGLYARGKFAGGKKVDDNAVARWIQSGGDKMPGFAGTLAPNQVRPLIAYLRTL